MSIGDPADGFVELEYSRAELPYGRYDPAQLQEEVNQVSGHSHCCGVYDDTPLCVRLAFTICTPSQATVGNVVREHVPHVIHLEAFQRENPREWWALCNMTVQTRREKILRAIRDQDGAQYLGYLWRMAHTFERRRHGRRPSSKAT